MPAEVFYHYSDTDLGALIAYLKTLPPVNNELPPTAVGPIARLFLALGQLPPEIIPASVINQAGPRPPTPSPSVTAAYGEYLGHICTACHGLDLTGGAARDAQSLPPPNLTRNTADWLETDFIRTLRTGTTPAGQQLDPDQMPWRSFGKMTDDELRAVWLFVKSKPVPIDWAKAKTWNDRIGRGSGRRLTRSRKRLYGTTTPLSPNEEVKWHLGAVRVARQAIYAHTVTALAPITRQQSSPHTSAVASSIPTMSRSEASPRARAAAAREATGRSGGG
jgi:cytochrome c553